MLRTRTTLAFDAVLLAALVRCNTSSAAPHEPATASTPDPAAAARAADAPVTAGPTTPTPSAPSATDHPWTFAAADERLDHRIAAPAGFTRAPVEDGSFGAFLRSLPLLPDGAPVVDFRGGVVHEGHHPNIAAVVDIDVGTTDLQQCADSVIRLHGEWRYGLGRRDVSYLSGAGPWLSYPKYLAGERATAQGPRLVVQPAAAPATDSHGTFRRYLDEVFAWLNTASLEREGVPVARDDLRAGDFFVMPDHPFGHAVLVLDVARSGDGPIALLLGQGYMPAQSFQVLRPDRTSAWFVVDPKDAFVATPFWKPFPWSALRRLR